MLVNIYNTKDDLVATSISGGRPHFAHRLPERAVMVYPYEVKFGENYHVLSAYIFGDDTFWWVLDDLNKPKKAFSFKVGDKINLPDRMVKKQGKKIF